MDDAGSTPAAGPQEQLHEPSSGATDEARAEADRRLADRLEAASREPAPDPADAPAGELDARDVERVIRRALELEASAGEPSHTITTGQLERIAAEIGVDRGYVHQALGELQLEPAPRSRLEAFILPDDLLETEPISGLTRAELDEAIARWMKRNEGLTPLGKVPNGMRWDVDRRTFRQFAAKRRSGSQRIARVAGGDVTHRVHSVDDREHVVAMQAQGAVPLFIAKLALVLAVVLMGIGIATSLGSLGEFIRGLIGFGLGATGLAVAGVLGARRWATTVRRALRRSLTGLAEAVRTRRPWFRRPKR